MYPIDVLHLIQGLEIGGLEIMVINLLEGIDRSRYRPSICCYDVFGSLADGLSDKGISLHLIKRKPGIDYLYPLRLGRFLTERRVDILHLHNPTAFFYGTLAGEIARIPVIIYTEHARDISVSTGVKMANRFLSKRVTKIVAVGESSKRYLVEREGIEEKRILTIYNGTDAKKFENIQNSQALRDELGLTRHQRVIGIVARLDPIKNHACLIRAMREVVTRLPGTRLLIIGDGPLRDDLRSLTAALDLEQHIKFLGARNNIPELLSVLDVFVLCSFSEGLSLTLVEACAAAKPIVASNVGGNGEVVEHQCNGLLVPSDESEALADAIMDILTNDGKAKRMGRMARKKFEEKFTLDIMVKKYESLYESCLRTKRRPRLRA